MVSKKKKKNPKKLLYEKALDAFVNAQNFTVILIDI